jgi:YD repeat-containing protein
MDRRFWRLACASLAVIAMAFGTAEAQTASTETYSYDSLGRLKSVVYQDGTRVDYQYDKLGNRTQLVVAPPVNHNPVANADSASTVAGASVDISVLSNDTDPDSNPLTVTSATTPAHGTTTVVNGATQVRYAPTAGYTGSDTFNYSISDGQGGTASAAVTVTVNAAPTNHNPVANTDSITTGYNQAAANITVLSNDTDADGDTLTITSATNGSHGAVTVNSGATVTYTPTSGYSGSDSFTYTISDGHGGTATGTVNVTVNAPSNSAPTANDDFPTASATYTGGTLGVKPSVTFDPRTNDTDPDSDTLSVTAVTQPANGNVTFNGVSITYTTKVGYKAVTSFTDTFTYTISDGHGHTATATVTVDVEVDDGTGGIGG